jgi:hypothetical protein
VEDRISGLEDKVDRTETSDVSDVQKKRMKNCEWDMQGL